MRSLRLSPERYAELQARARKPEAKPVGLLAADRLYRNPPSKYGNEKTDGYDSKREARRAQVLKLMEQGGEIAELREQVPYELIATQRDTAGKVIERGAAYVADFTYRVVKTGEFVCEDAKGHRTRDYIMKRKLMLERHGIRITEV